MSGKTQQDIEETKDAMQLETESGRVNLLRDIETFREAIKIISDIKHT